MSENNFYKKSSSKDSQRVKIKSSSKDTQYKFNDDINTNINNNLGLGTNDDIIMADNTKDNKLNKFKMADLKQINEERKRIGLRPFENVYCKICKKYNEHVPWLCPDYTCYICRDKGKHFANNCPKKPRICQWCKNDLNPLNVPQGKIAHEDFQSCPNRPTIIFTKRTKCILCKRFGHVAQDCNFSNANTYYNFNGFRRNNYTKYKRGYKRGRGKFRGK